jgi:hypothetical protein
MAGWCCTWAICRHYARIASGEGFSKRRGATEDSTGSVTAVALIGGCTGWCISCADRTTDASRSIWARFMEAFANLRTKHTSTAETRRPMGCCSAFFSPITSRMRSCGRLEASRTSRCVGRGGNDSIRSHRAAWHRRSHTTRSPSRLLLEAIFVMRADHRSLLFAQG